MEACWAHNPEVRGSKPRSATIVKHQKILPRSNTQLYYNNGGHNNNLKTLRRFHDVDDVTVKDNQ